MSRRALIIALVVSATLNVFAVAAGVTVLVGRDKVERGVAAQSRPPRSNSPMQLIARLDPAVGQPVRDAMRASALAARPDFEEARTARREAVALASAETFDPARVKALLDRSRAAEIRGRTRLEADMLQILSTLEPKDRAIMAQVLSRRSRNRDRQPAAAPAPAVAARR